MHGTGQRYVAALQSQMDMICHETKGVNTKPEPAYALLQKEIEAIPVVVAKEYGLTAVATKHDVIKSAGKMDARFACHVANVHPVLHLVNLEA